MDSDTVHILTAILTPIGAMLGAALRGSKWDPHLRAKLKWLTQGLKGLARHTVFPLEPEPFVGQFDAPLPPTNRRSDD